MDPVVEAAKNREKTTAAKAGRQALFSKKPGKPKKGDALAVDDAAAPANAPIKKGRS